MTHMLSLIPPRSLLFFYKKSDMNLTRFTCNQGVGSTLLNVNGECVEFNVPYHAIEVAGGGSDSCFLQLFWGPNCQQQVPSNFGPINFSNLGGCTGPFQPNDN